MSCSFTKFCLKKIAKTFFLTVLGGIGLVIMVIGITVIAFFLSIVVGLAISTVTFGQISSDSWNGIGGIGFVTSYLVALVGVVVSGLVYFASSLRGSYERHLKETCHENDKNKGQTR